MSASRATYLDSSAIVKLVVRETETAALRSFLRRREVVVSSSLARMEVTRAVLHLGGSATRRAKDVLRRVDLVRLSDRLLDAAGALQPASVRSLDAIHLATAQELGSDLAVLVTYDGRMAAAARELGLKVANPGSGKAAGT